MCAAIVAAAPVTVRVTVPEALHRVLLWPLELAYVGGKPLVDRDDVGFVYDVDAGAVGVAAPQEIRLDRLPDDDAGGSDPARPVELVAAWSVRESILEAGGTAAARLGQWQNALSSPGPSSPR